MNEDFLSAILVGWIILFSFWIFILIFIYFRKPKNSKLTLSLTIKSLVIFVIGFAFLLIL